MSIIDQEYYLNLFRGDQLFLPYLQQLNKSEHDGGDERQIILLH